MKFLGKFTGRVLFVLSFFFAFSLALSAVEVTAPVYDKYGDVYPGLGTGASANREVTVVVTSVIGSKPCVPLTQNPSYVIPYYLPTESVTYTATIEPSDGPLDDIRWGVEGESNDDTAMDTLSFTTHFHSPGEKTIHVTCGDSSQQCTTYVFRPDIIVAPVGDTTMDEVTEEDTGAFVGKGGEGQAVQITFTDNDYPSIGTEFYLNYTDADSHNHLEINDGSDWTDFDTGHTYTYTGSKPIAVPLIRGTTVSDSLKDITLNLTTSLGSGDRAKVTVFEVNVTSPNENDVHLKGEEIKWEAQLYPNTISPDTATWSFSYITGNGNPSSGSGQTEGNQRIFYSTIMSGDVTTPDTVVFKAEATINEGIATDTRAVLAIIPNVTKVSFTQDHQLYDNVSAETIITDPVWIKNLGEDVTKDSEVAYTRSVYTDDVLTDTSYAYAKPEPKGCLHLTNSTSVQVEGTGDENFEPTGATFYHFTWGPSELIIKSSPLRGSVGIYNEMEVNWKYRVRKKSAEAWGDWIDMNQSSHKKVYITLDTPQAPMATPWTQVLDYACVWADGATTDTGAAGKVTEGIYASGYEYDNVNGASRYYNTTTDKFKLTTCLSEWGNSDTGINCWDCANMVAIFSNSLGCNLDLCFIEDSGSDSFLLNYIKPIGRDWTNDPFTATGRDGFAYHEIVGWGQIYDACLQVDDDADPTTSPHTGKQPENMTFNVNTPSNPYDDYRGKLVDPSDETSVSPTSESPSPVE